MQNLGRVAGSAPPVRRLKVVVGNGVNDGVSVGGVIFIPQRVHAAGMRFVGDDDDVVAALVLEGAANSVQFIRGVSDGSFQDVYCLSGYALAPQNLQVQLFFAGIVQAKILQAFDGVIAGVSKPDFFRVAVVIKLGGFHGAGGNVAAENGDGGGLAEGLLDDQPSANAKKGDGCNDGDG